MKVPFSLSRLGKTDALLFLTNICLVSVQMPPAGANQMCPEGPQTDMKTGAIPKNLLLRGTLPLYIEVQCLIIMTTEINPVESDHVLLV